MLGFSDRRDSVGFALDLDALRRRNPQHLVVSVAIRAVAGRFGRDSDYIINVIGSSEASSWKWFVMARTRGPVSPVLAKAPFVMPLDDAREPAASVSGFRDFDG